MKFKAYYDSPIGSIVLESDGQALTKLAFLKEDENLEDENSSKMNQNLLIFEEAVRWLDLYFQGRDPEFTPPIQLEGTPFRRRVWEIVCTIPFGETMTYGDIAKIIAKEKGIDRMASQAVGGAVAHNPIALIVPCHRVNGAHGQLVGYGGDLPRKIWLLKWEGNDIEQMHWPKSYLYE